MLFGIEPRDQIRHKRRRLFGRGVFKTLPRYRDNGIGAGFVAAGMDCIRGLNAPRQLAINGVVLPQKGLVELADESLREGLGILRLNLHHIQAHIVRFHLLKVLHGCITNGATQQQQNLRLSVRQRIALNMVAVVVKVKHKLAI